MSLPIRAGSTMKAATTLSIGAAHPSGGQLKVAAFASGKGGCLHFTKERLPRSC
jgi:hypothetical protein